ncbi:helix-turn-helix transcriptional regulator [Micromonospora sp. KC213]|uniref:helix-turn-helix domain-containing protein n=1 Tax=Micromonospora sp. KC213 TaxID=2530378 RepID=UPI0014055289|nr:helix-turn-helix transcriptional regulator [Micromonospora sp. KC213]
MSDGVSFGDWLAGRMDEVGLPRPADLSRATGIDASLIGRWLRGESLPGVMNLRRLAPALNTTELDLLARAGHLEDAKPAPPATRQRPAVVVELERLLGPNSPLPVDKREALENLATALVAPYRSYKRSRRAG